MKDLFSTIYAAFDLSAGIELTIISIDHALKNWTKISFLQHYGRPIYLICAVDWHLKILRRWIFSSDDMDKRYQMIYLLYMLPIWKEASIHYRTTER